MPDEFELPIVGEVAILHDDAPPLTPSALSAIELPAWSADISTNCPAVQSPAVEAADSQVLLSELPGL